jgi:uncharacterized protein
MSRSEAVRAVVDTNVLISGLIAGRGANHDVIQALYQQRFTLLLSDALLQEYEEVLARPALTHKYPRLAAERQGLLAVLQTDGQFVSPAASLPLPIRDPKDEKVLACALGGNADYLVSNDPDLLTLAEDPRLGSLKIVRVDAFLTLLASDEARS